MAYDDGTIDWTTSDPGNASPGLSPRYGLLPALVASLGGDFVVSKDLNAGDLRDASVLIVLPSATLPNRALQPAKCPTTCGRKSGASSSRAAA